MYCTECNTEEGTPHKEGCSQKEATLVTEAEKTIGYNDGDLYDEDTGDFIGNIYEDSISEQTVPANFSLFIKGFWYMYKLDKRVQHES